MQFAWHQKPVTCMSIVVAEKQICTQEGQNEIIIVASTVAKLVYFEMLYDL
jgi:hypothetical protein